MSAQQTPTPLETAIRWLPIKAVSVEGTDGFHRILTASGHFIASCVNAREAVAFVELCNSHAALLAALERLTSAVEFTRTMGATRGGSFAGIEELERAENAARAALKAAKGEA